MESMSITSAAPPPPPPPPLLPAPPPPEDVDSHSHGVDIDRGTTGSDAEPTIPGDLVPAGGPVWRKEAGEEGLPAGAGAAAAVAAEGEPGVHVHLFSSKSKLLASSPSPTPSPLFSRRCCWERGESGKRGRGGRRWLRTSYLNSLGAGVRAVVASRVQTNTPGDLEICVR